MPLKPLPKEAFTAKDFIDALTALKPKTASSNLKFYSGPDAKTKSLGVRMGDIFKLSKQYSSLSITETAKLLENPFYEVRMGAVSIMDFKARDKKTTVAEKKALFDLYIKKHNRIDNWDLVDRSAPHVVGGYLADKPRKILYTLAKSTNPWERRTAIVATWYFIRQNDVADTFAIAKLLLKDKDEYVQKAAGSWLREAGKRDKEQLFALLDKYAATMPRVTLRYAIEKLDKKMRDHYMQLAK